MQERKIINFAKKIIKPVAIKISQLYVRTLLSVHYSIFHKFRNSMPVLPISLSLNDMLVFNIYTDKLEYHIKDSENMPGNKFIWAGDWDKNIFPIEEHEKFIMIKEAFKENKKYEDIQFYSIAMDKILNGNPLRRGELILDSRENIIKYFEKQEKIFMDIKKNGYKEKIASEVGVAVDRNGQLLHFRQGHHSLAFAKILGIRNIVVRVRAIHSLWLERCIKKYQLSPYEAIKKCLEELHLNNIADVNL